MLVVTRRPIGVEIVTVFTTTLRRKTENPGKPESAKIPDVVSGERRDDSCESSTKRKQLTTGQEGTDKKTHVKTI